MTSPAQGDHIRKAIAALRRSEKASDDIAVQVAKLRAARRVIDDKAERQAGYLVIMLRKRNGPGDAEMVRRLVFDWDLAE